MRRRTANSRHSTRGGARVTYRFAPPSPGTEVICVIQAAP